MYVDPAYLMKGIIELAYVAINLTRNMLILTVSHYFNLQVGDTALHIAIKYLEATTLLLLLSHPGIDINLKNDRGHTAMMDVQIPHYVQSAGKNMQQLSSGFIWKGCVVWKFRCWQEHTDSGK